MCWDRATETKVTPSPEWKHGYKVMMRDFNAPSHGYANKLLTPINYACWKHLNVGVVVNATEFAKDAGDASGFGFQIFTSFDAAFSFCRKYGWVTDVRAVIADVWYRNVYATANAKDHDFGEVFGTCVAAQDMIVMPGVRQVREMVG